MRVRVQRSKQPPEGPTLASALRSPSQQDKHVQKKTSPSNSWSRPKSNRHQVRCTHVFFARPHFRKSRTPKVYPIPGGFANFGNKILKKSSKSNGISEPLSKNEDSQRNGHVHRWMLRFVLRIPYSPNTLPMQQSRFSLFPLGMPSNRIAPV